MSISQQNAPTTAPRIPVWFRTVGAIRITWQRAALFAILLVSAALNVYALDPTYFTNEYYAAAVRSMLANWHNFFYNAYDPGGYITVDKPPVALWLQTASAWLFGYNGISILLPSIAAGMASVALVYHMVRRIFGTVAGLLAALALAVTPIFVVMNRHNNPESLLILSLVVAAWAMSRAVEQGRLRWLLLSVAMIGLGFNIKMLEAFIVLPALYLVYLLLAPLGWKKRIMHLTLATALLVAVSLSWAVAVDLTPANLRPYIGSSSNNSVLNLIFNYNGLGRIEGNEMGGPGQGTRNGGQPPAGFQPPNGGQPPAGFQPQNGTRGMPNNPGGRGPGGIIAGQAGLFRMFDPSLAGEAGWLLPLALIGLGIAAVQTWRRFRSGEARWQRQAALIIWGGWLLSFMAVFSLAKGIFHSYYLVMLAPAIAALVGIGIEACWHAYRQGRWRSLLLPLSLAITGGFQLNILSRYTNWNRDLALGVIVIELICAAALLIAPALHLNLRWKAGFAGLGLLGLLAAPLAWSINAMVSQTYINATLPTAVPSGSGNSSLLALIQASWNSNFGVAAVIAVGMVILLLAVVIFRRSTQGISRLERPLTLATAALVVCLGIALVFTSMPPVDASAWPATTAQSTGMIGNPSMGLGNTDALVSFLEANRNGTKYLLVTTSSQNASAIIIKTGQPVMALGGFSGSDQVLTADQFAALVANKTIRYVLLNGQGMGGPGGGSQSITSWVQQHGTLVDTQLWSSGSGSAGQLYDLAPQS